jgi:hypothetical protein
MPKEIQKIFKMPSQTLDYFDHPVTYDASRAVKDLGRFGVSCPPFTSYVQKLVAFYLAKVDVVTRGAMI